MLIFLEVLTLQQCKVILSKIVDEGVSFVLIIGLEACLILDFRMVLRSGCNCYMLFLSKLENFMDHGKCVGFKNYKF